MKHLIRTDWEGGREEKKIEIRIKEDKLKCGNKRPRALERKMKTKRIEKIGRQ